MPAPRPWRFSVSDYRRIGDAGVFGPEERVELLDGTVIALPRIGSQHAVCVARINALFHRLVGNGESVRIHNPLLLDDSSEPLPDVLLVGGMPDRYVDEHPRPSDVLLLIEVSDSSLSYDRGVKLSAYARAGIREVWIVDLAKVQVEVYSEPTRAGYQSRTIARGDDRLAPQAVASISVTVREITG